MRSGETSGPGSRVGRNDSHIRGGKRYEVDLLGTPVFNEAARVYFNQIASKDGAQYRAKVKDLVRVAELAQQPLDRRKPFVKDLRLEILDRLGVDAFGKEAASVDVFSTIQTPLDDVGVDALVRIGDRYIALDPTLKPGKDSFGADVLIPGEIPDPSEDEEQYLARVDEVATDVVRVYSDRSERFAKPQFRERTLTWQPSRDYA